MAQEKPGLRPLPPRLTASNLYRCSLVALEYEEGLPSQRRSEVLLLNRGTETSPVQSERLTRYSVAVMSRSARQRMLEASCVIPKTTAGVQFANEYFRRLASKQRSVTAVVGGELPIVHMWGDPWVTCWQTGTTDVWCDGSTCSVAGAFAVASDGVMETTGLIASINYNCDNGCFISGGFYDCPGSGGGDVVNAGGDPDDPGGGGTSGSGYGIEDVAAEAEPGTSCADDGTGQYSYIPPPSFRADFGVREDGRSHLSGPYAALDEDSGVEAAREQVEPCAQGNCTAISVDQSNEILHWAMWGPEWTYTQGGVRGGREPAVDLSNNTGDCTDFTWKGTSDVLGGYWPHDYNTEKLSTNMFHTLSDAQLLSRGYERVSITFARAGDVVVRGGHAGIYIGPDASGKVEGIANNGLPATPTRANKDKTTGLYDFSRSGDDYPEFFRPVVCPP